MDVSSGVKKKGRKTVVCVCGGECICSSDEAWTEEHGRQRVGVGVRLVADQTHQRTSQQPGTALLLTFCLLVRAGFRSQKEKTVIVLSMPLPLVICCCGLGNIKGVWPLKPATQILRVFLGGGSSVL